MAAFKYRGRERTVEDVDKRSKVSGGGYDSIFKSDTVSYKAKEGDCAIRIMPPSWKDVETWGKDWSILVHFHRNVGADKGTYLCLDKMQGETCPICEARRSMTDEDELDAIRVQTRPLCYVIDRDNEKAGPQANLMPMGMFKDIQSRSIDKKNDEVIYIDDPDEGFDIQFRREGADIKTRYVSIEVDRDPSPLAGKASKQEDWLDYITDNPLPDILNFFDAEHIEKVLFGKSERRKGRGGDEEEDRRGGGRRERGRRDEEEEESREDAAPRSKRARRGEDDEDAKPVKRKARDEDEEDEVDEEEKAVVKKRGRAKDDEAEAEAEEDEKPRSGSRRAAAKEETNGRTRRRLSDEKEDDDKEDAEEKDSPSSQARERVGRLRERASRSRD